MLSLYDKQSQNQNNDTRDKSEQVPRPQHCSGAYRSREGTGTGPQAPAGRHCRQWRRRRRLCEAGRAPT